MEYLTNVRYHKNMIPTCYQVSAMQRYSESLAKSTAYAPDANLAAADNTSSYYAFERKFLGVVMNSQPGMMYWNGGDGGGKGSPDGGMNAGHVNYALGATSGILAGKYALGGVTDLLNTMQASSDAMK